MCMGAADVEMLTVKQRLKVLYVTKGKAYASILPIAYLPPRSDRSMNKPA